MAVFKSTLKTIDRDLKRRFRALKREMPHIIRVGADGTVEPMKEATPVGRWGKLQRTWRVKKIKGGASLYNRAPYAGIVEVGARPHPVSKEGRRKIKAWAKKMLNLSPRQAGNVAQAIANTIQEKGQEPTYFVRNRLGQVKRDMHSGIEMAMGWFSKIRY